MKPVLINYLIKVSAYEKVICVDCDLFFFNDFSFLFEALDQYNILLTPHWRSSDPFKDPNGFKYLFNHGLFNAGFIGVNKHATAAMDWWANVCWFSCANSSFEGQYVDQTYLNLLPVYFENVHILKHQGCNVAQWNVLECKRILQMNGSVLINNRYPIVFIHFVSTAKREYDIRLSAYLDEYLDTLALYSTEIYEKEKKRRNLTPVTGQSKEKDLRWLFLRLVRMSILKTIINFKKYESSDSILIFCGENSGGEWLTWLLSNIPGTAVIRDPFNPKYGSAKKTGASSGPFYPSEADNPNKNSEITIYKILSGKLVNHWTSKYSSIQSFSKSNKLIVEILHEFALLPYITTQISFAHKPILVLRHPCAFALLLMYQTNQEIDSNITGILNTRQDQSSELKKFMTNITMPFEKLVVYWCLLYAEILNTSENQKKWVIVSYENIQQNWQKELTKICDELNLEYPAISDEQYTMTNHPFLGTNSYSDTEATEWGAILSEEDRQRVERILQYFDVEIYSAWSAMPVSEFN
jgi:lipopolysaccharide biosynthesis glycosyltransferase